MTTQLGTPRKWKIAAAIACICSILALPAQAVSLRGTTGSLDRQNAQARNHDFTFLSTKSQVARFVENGWLVRVEPNHVYRLKGVSFPYSRPEVRLFLERLGQQYSAVCGEELVVTSLIRPRNYQPRNASPRSVHPTGMALDLHRPHDRGCRAWLERVLLSLEDQGVLEATYERRPPHYHVAVYPDLYKRYVERLVSGRKVRNHRVGRGDTLWRIAVKYQTTVAAVRRQNDLKSNKIYPGQVLEVPISQ
ncbi:MAG: LysM peptidoglycan-binding domain-containing protein [Acidobacteria bacterium]|nr:LysM peptidoglycan-binding domain-containing protein [Acidobacteriota bacterium]